MPSTSTSASSSASTVDDLEDPQGWSFLFTRHLPNATCHTTCDEAINYSSHNQYHSNGQAEEQDEVLHVLFSRIHEGLAVASATERILPGTTIGSSSHLSQHARENINHFILTGGTQNPCTINHRRCTSNKGKCKISTIYCYNFFIYLPKPCSFYYKYICIKK